MKAKEIRNISTADLEKRILSLKKELFDLKFQAAVGQLENTAKLKGVKKDIARMKTVINERKFEESK